MKCYTRQYLLHLNILFTEINIIYVVIILYFLLDILSDWK